MNLLIVEDNKEILEPLVSCLIKEGYVVDTASDGEEGLYKAKIHDYDLVLLDIGLPKVSGDDVCKEIRSYGKTMPIIILSVESEINTKSELLSLGADDYVTKPFSLVELSARIKACLRRPRSIVPEILTSGEVALNTSARIVTSCGRDVHLTPKEFFLLEYLMKHAGKVVSRHELLEHVWGSDADLFTNTIETHIANIRRKLALKKDFISTVSNGGYKIN